MENLKDKIREFLAISFGSGGGYVFGYGYLSGSGYGYGDGDGYKHLNNREVYIIDDMEMLIYSIRGDIARGAIINKDLTLTKCFIVKSGNHFAHGSTIKEAREDLMFKVLDRDKSEFESLTLDDRLDVDAAIQCYRVITGACAIGTKTFVENKLQGVLKDSYTIREIIALTIEQYGASDFEHFFKNKHYGKKNIKIYTS